LQCGAHSGELAETHTLILQIHAPASGALSGELAETLLNHRTAFHAVQSVSPVRFGTVDRSRDVPVRFLFWGSNPSCRLTIYNK
jgi:hypothetical protein